MPHEKWAENHMKYSNLFNFRKTVQTQPIPGSAQAKNNVGGFTWTVDPWTRLDRFLILGSDVGTYYVSPKQLTATNADNVIQLLRTDGVRVVHRIEEISKAGRAPRNDAAVYALALCASFGDDATRKAALAALPSVCRTGTHLFAFAELCNGLRGWGRGLRRAIGDWYNAKSASEVEHQLLKYQQREGWASRDLLRLAHPKPATEEHKVLYAWATKGAVPEEASPESALRIRASARLHESKEIEEAKELILQNRLPREAVPSELLQKAEVWEALLEHMPMTAMIRNLGTMTRLGLLAPGSEATEKVLATLGDRDRLRKARVHPMTLLLAQATYAKGVGVRSRNQWLPVPAIVDALNDAFYAAFEHVEPTGKRLLLGVDVSGSMSGNFLSGTWLSAAEAATAMALVAMHSEKRVVPMAFSDKFRSLPISPKMRLDSAMELTTRQTFGATDCALPMLFAKKHNLQVDAFVVLTDNETWFGKVHPAQALADYRRTSGIDAKLIVVGMTSTGFSIANPNDKGMMDVVGFDSTVPAIMNQFLS